MPANRSYITKPKARTPISKARKAQGTISFTAKDDLLNKKAKQRQKNKRGAP